MIKIAKFFFLLLIGTIINGCSSVTPISGEKRESISADKCNVKVYQTLHEAEKYGLIKELCIITGTSAPSLSHTVEIAISKHKDKVCECGTNNAYVQSRIIADGWGPAQVTLVGFEYEK